MAGWMQPSFRADSAGMKTNCEPALQHFSQYCDEEKRFQNEWQEPTASIQITRKVSTARSFGQCGQAWLAVNHQSQPQHEVNTP